jgi:hypothetical protein
VVFLYGSLAWGVFPGKERVSFEGHLTGTLAGMVLAFYFRHKGPQRKKYRWEEETEEEQDDDENAYWKIPEEKTSETLEPPNGEEEKEALKYIYHFKASSNNQGTNS